VPEEFQAHTDARGEASLRGHLKAEGKEQTGSQSYIPPDPKDDKALHTALDLIRGVQKNPAYPPNSENGSSASIRSRTHSRSSELVSTSVAEIDNWEGVCPAVKRYRVSHPLATPIRMTTPSMKR